MYCSNAFFALSPYVVIHVAYVVVVPVLWGFVEHEIEYFDVHFRRLK